MTEPANTPPNESINPGRLARLLVQQGVVSVPQVRAAMAVQNNENTHLVKALIDQGFLTEASLTNFLVKHLKLPRLNLSDYNVSQDILKKVPQDLCIRYRLMPIDVLGKNLTLAMVDPLDDVALAAVQQACPDFRLKPFLCSLSDFDLVASRLLRSVEQQKGDSEISLKSLGISGPARKTETLAPVPTRSAPPG